MSDDDKKSDQPVINITSHNQSGGITAHTVYQVAGRAQFTRPIADELLKVLPVGKPVQLLIVGSSADQAVGQAVHKFLIDNGYAISHVATIGTMAPPPDQPFSLQITQQESILTIAPSAR